MGHWFFDQHTAGQARCFESACQAACIAAAKAGLSERRKSCRNQTTVDAGYAWSKGQRWKDLIFTPEQPFLPGEAGENWLKRKELYRQLKAEGKL